MQKQLIDPKVTQAEIISLMQDIALDAFYLDGRVKNAALAEVVWKINSCLYNPCREIKYK
jgi:hypothetical protein